MGQYLVIGTTGYAGSHLARYLVDQEHYVRGLVRSSESEQAQQLAADGVSIWEGNLCQPETLVGIANDIEYVINLAGCSPLQLSEARHLFLDGNRFLLAACSRVRSVRAYVVASNLSPYGDRGDAWLDEETAIAPNSAWGDLTVEAELALISLLRTYRFPIMLARLGVVYGPNRNYLDRLIHHSALCIGDGLNYVSHIAIDDLVYILDQIAVFGQAGAIYNVGDQQPVRLGEIYRSLADRVGMQAPRFIPKQIALCSGMDPNVIAMSTASTRISNQRLHDEFAISLRYPSIATWFDQHLQSESWQAATEPVLGMNLLL